MVDSPEIWGREVVTVDADGHPLRVWQPRPQRVTELLEERNRWPDRDYLVCGDRRITFEEHYQAVQAVARRLVESGVSPGDRVLLLAGNSPEFVAAWWATLAIGAIAVLGNRWWTPAQVEQCVVDTSPTLVGVDARTTTLVTNGKQLLNLDDLTDVWEDPITANPAPTPVSETDPAVVIYTSGTTGQAKGVVLSHRAIVANLHNLLDRSRRRPSEVDSDAPQQVSLLTVPLFHMSGMQAMTLAAVTGDRLVFPSPGPVDATTILELIQQESVSSFAAVPTVLGRIVKHPDLASFDTSSVRSVTMGGMFVHPSIVEQVRVVFPAASRRVGALYGMTESGGVLTTIGGSQLIDKPTSSGLPLPVVELRIAEVEEDGSGEILVRSPTNMSGYWGQPYSPELDADGWLHTGDIGRIEGDHLYVVGRSKEIVIRGGENIAATRVESCLLAHPDVLEAAVLPLEHPDLGEEVAAVVTVKPQSALSVSTLKAHAADSLAHFEVPSAWWIRYEPLPLTASGKVKKAELVEAWPTASRDGLPPPESE
jgi:long-chain acyl-CoA synthetase